jgi:hypothetical protein
MAAATASAFRWGDPIDTTPEPKTLEALKRVHYETVIVSALDKAEAREAAMKATKRGATADSWRITSRGIASITPIGSWRWEVEVKITETQDLPADSGWHR